MQTAKRPQTVGAAQQLPLCAPGSTRRTVVGNHEFMPQCSLRLDRLDARTSKHTGLHASWQWRPTLQACSGCSRSHSSRVSRQAGRAARAVPLGQKQRPGGPGGPHAGHTLTSQAAC